MHLFRSLATGALLVGAATGLAVMGAGSAAAVTVQPVDGGVQVDLNHDDTVWVRDHNVGGMVAGLGSPAAASFGQSLTVLSQLASQFPQGRVAFTVFGPLDNLNGTMVALDQ